jgi:hypothetical protein
VISRRNALVGAVATAALATTLSAVSACTFTRSRRITNAARSARAANARRFCQELIADNAQSGSSSVAGSQILVNGVRVNIADVAASLVPGGLPTRFGEVGFFADRVFATVGIDDIEDDCGSFAYRTYLSFEFDGQSNAITGVSVI